MARNITVRISVNFFNRQFFLHFQPALYVFLSVISQNSCNNMKNRIFISVAGFALIWAAYTAFISAADSAFILPQARFYFGSGSASV